jgi:putative ABC transport system permease protein
MRTAQTVLTVIQERGKQHKPIERVYKLLFNRDFYLNAYAKLYPNNGAMTKGVTDVAYTSILTMKATVSGVKNVVLLIGGMIGAVFALVGLINFINLVMTNIITRRHEFATMQSIGMTNRQLRKMMISESFSYVLLAGIVGTLAAAVLGITLVRSFVEISPSSIMMTFQMTLLPALIMLILFLALAFIVPVVALRLFNNRSVVERLRVNE